MSLKENVNYVKDELNSEEKFLESFVKVERFYKKNKFIIIAIIVIAIGASVAYYTTKSLQRSNQFEANVAFNTVIENPKDAAALATLKDKNVRLYEIAQYINAAKENQNASTEIKYLKELVAYKKALETKDINQLNTISMQNDFLLKEFAIFNKALLLTNEGKFEDAKATLKLIPSNSKVTELANILNHYLVSK